MAVAPQTTAGRWMLVKHNTLRLCKHSSIFSECHFCIYQSAIGDEKEKEITVFVHMVYFRLRGIYTLLVCGGGVFFSLA